MNTNNEFKSAKENEEDIDIGENNVDSDGFGDESEAAYTYGCPGCGAGLVFNAEKQKFTCEFCLSEYSEEDLMRIEAEKTAETEKENVNKNGDEYCAHMNEYHCPNCGADIATDESTAADFCYYCHSPVVFTGKLSGQMRPSKIIPFAFDKEEAEKRFLAVAKKKLFVPKDFFAPSQTEKITGVYYPFWVTDADTDSTMQATGKKVRIWRSGNTEYTETSVYSVYRRGDIHFEDIVTSALSKADKKMLEGILPYPSEVHREFSMPFLSGFMAKKRDIERAQLVPEVRCRMTDYSNQLFRGTTSGYSSFVVQQSLLNVKRITWDYTLMPIWILTYKAKNKDKVYTFAMNGNTGKIYGEYPLSFGKLAALFGIIVGVGTLLLSLLGGLL